MELLERTMLKPTAKINDRLASLDSAPLNKQVSLAYLLRRPEDSDPWYIETSTHDPRRWYPISITKPDVVRFD